MQTNLCLPVGILWLCSISPLTPLAIIMWFIAGSSDCLLPSSQLSSLWPGVFSQFLHTFAKIVARLFSQCGGGDGHQVPPSWHNHHPTEPRRKLSQRGSESCWVSLLSTSALCGAQWRVWSSRKGNLCFKIVSWYQSWSHERIIKTLGRNFREHVDWLSVRSVWLWIIVIKEEWEKEDRLVCDFE